MFDSHFPDLLNATAIVGIDAFYWDAVFANDFATIQISRLIQFAALNKKVLILGTVPVEREDHVFWMKLPDFINKYAWHPPQSTYVSMINSTI